ncbi:MAG: Thioredoxin domain [Firmicutes bacterium]|nr:Thioredoxin domain [Bacillota bacterium]
MMVKVYQSCCGGEKVLDTVNEAIRLSGTVAQVETVNDMIEVAKAGIISTPAITINNRVVASGRVPKVQDLVTILINAAAKET